MIFKAIIVKKPQKIIFKFLYRDSVRIRQKALEFNFNLKDIGGQ